MRKWLAGLTAGVCFLMVVEAQGKPKDNGPQVVCPVVVEDLEQDGEKEIILIVGKTLYVFRPDGTIRSGFPINLGDLLIPTFPPPPDMPPFPPPIPPPPMPKP